MSPGQHFPSGRPGLFLFPLYQPLSPPFIKNKKCPKTSPGRKQPPHESPHRVSSGVLFSFLNVSWLTFRDIITLLHYAIRIKICQMFFSCILVKYNAIIITMNRKTFSLRVDESLMKALRHLAIDFNKSVGSLLEEAIQDLLKKYEKTFPKKGKP